VIKEKNVESAAELSEEEWFEAMNQAEEKWITEFDAHDLDRIEVKSGG